MNPETKKKLDNYTDGIARLLEDKKGIGDDINELVTKAMEETGVMKGVIKQLAKEKNFTKEQRAELDLREEQLDECRVALKMLEGTPLGDAAIAAAEKKATPPKKPEKAKTDKKPPPKKLETKKSTSMKEAAEPALA